MTLRSGPAIESCSPALSALTHYDPEAEGRLYPPQDPERFPTPMSRDWKDTGDLSNTPDNGYLGRVVSSRDRDETSGTSSTPTPGGSLNPTWVTWLMGFPLDWLHDSPEETYSEVRKYLGSPEESPSGSAS